MGELEKSIKLVLEDYEFIRTAIQKQYAKRPVNNNGTYCDCPSCGAILMCGDRKFQHYCKRCGQKLDWRKEQ